LIYAGTVWNLYEKLIDPAYTTEARRNWAKNMVPTYPSVVLYSVVDRNIIPQDTQPIEMLVGNPDQLDESEVTAYILSIDDRTLCADDEHTVLAIGPTFENWATSDPETYQKMKRNEEARLIAVLEKRFPNFSSAVRYAEVATPKTIERYTLKNGGAVAGPKQMLGQHMFRRLHTRSEWDNLFCCGESTVMGTGTPTVTTSGLSAANALLKKLGLQPFVYQQDMKNYVRIVEKPFTEQMLYDTYPEQEQKIMRLARQCRFCEKPSCTNGSFTDVRGMMRRVASGNFVGAKKAWLKAPVDIAKLKTFEEKCICTVEDGQSVAIREVVSYVEKYRFDAVVN
jgi:prolycopene isomerase